MESKALNAESSAHGVKVMSVDHLQELDIQIALHDMIVSSGGVVQCPTRHTARHVSCDSLPLLALMGGLLFTLCWGHTSSVHYTS